MRTYEQIKEEIIETNYLIALLLDKKKDELVGRLKVKLTNLIDEALEARSEEKYNSIN
jgi:hypothetical protein